MASKKKSGKGKSAIPVPEDLFNEKPAKRGPGRPKKVAAASSDEKPAKRRPGRPKGSKNKGSAPAVDTDAVELKVRKKPGRKPKVKSSAVADDGTIGISLKIKGSATLGDLVGISEMLKAHPAFVSMDARLF